MLYTMDNFQTVKVPSIPSYPGVLSKSCNIICGNNESMRLVTTGVSFGGESRVWKGWEENHLTYVTLSTPFYDNVGRTIACSLTNPHRLTMLGKVSNTSYDYEIANNNLDNLTISLTSS